MRDEDKTKGQLVSELDKMRQQFAVMEAQKAEWKRTEQVLRNLEQRYRILLEETPLGIMSVDIKGKITYVNNIILEHTGYSLDDLVGKNAFRLGLVTSETLSLLRKRLREKLMGEPPSPLIIQLKCKDGEWIWLEIRGKVLQKHGLPIGVQIIGEDITERKQAEERLSRSEENYKNVFDLAPDGILTVNTKGVVISCNAAFSNLSGFSKGEIVGKHFLKLPTLIKKDIPIYLKTFASLLKGEISKPMEFAWKHKDGTQRLGEAHISLMKREGKILGLQVIIRDVTERKRMEEELRKLNTISESTFFGADIATPEGEYTYVNESFARMHGYTRDEMVGIHWSRLFPGEQLEFIRQQRDHLLKEGDTFTFETERLRKDGSTFPSITTGAVVRDSKGNPLFTSGIIVDITERKQAEEALWESEQRYIHAEKLGQFGHWRRGFIYKEATWSAGTYRIFGVEPDQFKPTQGNIYHLIHPDDKEAVRRTRDDASLRGEKFDIEYRIIRPDGEERVLHSMADVYTDINGKRKGLFGTIIDITERKQAEEALLESEERYRAIVDLGASFNEAIIMTQDTGQGTAIHVYANEEWSRITGYSNEELIGTPYMDVIHPKNRREVLDRYKRRLKGEVLPSTYEFSVIRKDGAEVLLEAVGNFTMYRGKSATVAYLRDITGRKQAQEELRESEERYRAIIDLGAKVGEAIVMLQDTEKIIGRYVFVSDEWTHITGYSREELLGMSQADLIHPRYRAEAVERHHRRMRGETISELFEISIIRKDGAEVPIELTGAYTTYQGMPAHVVYMRDITERKRAEEEIAKFKTIADNAGYGVVIGDQENKIIYANEAYSQISGYSIDELTGQDVRLLYPEEQLDNMLRLRNKLMQEGRYTGEEVWHRRKDGTIFPTLMNGTAVKDKNGVPLFRAGSIIDITERNRAEEEIAKFKTIADIASYGVAIGPIKKLDYVNRSFAEMHGYSPDELIGKHYSILYTEEQLPVINRLRAHLLKTGGFINKEVWHKRKDGTLFPTLMAGSLIKDEEGNPSVIAGTVIDITERKQMEEERLKFEKLESIGTLAGGIAHDFNNILAGIMGNITLAERHVEPGGKAAERLLEAMKASLRARDLTQQMLTFARGGAPVKKTVSIAELLEDSATFALRGSKVKCEFSLPDDLWPVEIDEGQISQVITNLVINADEAMPEGGIINIGAKNTAIKRKGVLPLAKGNYVEITMKDEGIGIAKEHLDRIFDPYFTTKQKGSGLGLATTYSIIKNHDGRITVESELGTGTTFRIYLPASKKPSLVKKEAADDAPVRGKGRILVMDDEEMIREMLSNLLSTAGYEVELTSDGAEAIERYAKARESGQPFDAVIMDLTIPGGMGGKEAIGKLLEIDPEVKVIVSSGYSADPVMAKFRKYGFSAVATKPYSAGELERTLQRLLVRNK